MSNSRRKLIALIAHDNKKDEMIAFVKKNHETLSHYDLVATATTGGLIVNETGLDVLRMLSGPIGGDAQIAAKIAQGEVGAVFFFVDPLGKHPHDPDIQGLLRICNVHDVPLATNPATASYIISQRAL